MSARKTIIIGILTIATFYIVANSATLGFSQKGGYIETEAIAETETPSDEAEIIEEAVSTETLKEDKEEASEEPNEEVAEETQNIEPEEAQEEFQEIPEEEFQSEIETEEYIEESYDTYITYGDGGRLVIEDVGISVPLYVGYDDGTDYCQQIVDLEDAACLLDFRPTGDLSLGIADHRNQGFDGLHNVTPGMIARILYEDGSETLLECIEVDLNGTNSSEFIYDSQGRQVTNISPDILYMYTCNPESRGSVTVTLWKYI